MTQAYKIQKDILKLFQAKETELLSQDEVNNLNLYKGLVINSMEGLLAKIFSEIYSFYKDEWRNITRDYLELHPSESPVYNQLCKDFPDFIASDFFKNKYGSNNYFHELARYKWLDLKLYNSKTKARLENGFTQDYVIMDANFNIPLVISYLASDIEINKEDDMEIEKNLIFIFRDELETKTLILNQVTKEFIDELQNKQSLEAIKAKFLEKYSQQSSSIDTQIDSLIEYLKNMRILLI